MLRLGEGKLNRLFLGGTEINRAYLGGIQVFPNEWTPEDIAADTNHWDPSNLSSFVESGGLVSQLNDLIGTETLTQFDSLKQPITGASTINGRNAFLFDGIDDFMNKGSYPINNGDRAFFMVARTDSFSGGSASLFSTNNTINFQLDSTSSTDFFGEIDMQGGSNVDNPLTDGPHNGPSIYNVNFDKSGANVYNAYVDGFKRTVDATYSDALSATHVLRVFLNRGSTAFLGGLMGEFISTEDMSEDTRWKCEGYLAHKWFGPGALNNLPYNHPHKHFPPIVNEPSVPLYTPTTGSTSLTGLRWHDIADPDVIVEGLGGVQTVINKGSGTAQDLEQSSTSLRPSSSATLNGLGALEFQGGEYMQTLNASIAGSGNHFCFIVAEVDPPTGSSSSAMFSYKDENGAQEDFQYDADGGTNFNGRINTNAIGSDVSLTGGPFNALAVHNLNFNSNTGFYNAFVDGNQRAVDTAYGPTLDNTNPTLKIFANRGVTGTLNGRFGEFIRTTTATQNANDVVTGYLCWKWGTQGNLPSSHPYKNRPPTIND
ncbi:MAG: hypothetical protein ACYSR9_04185 [Planctomycetota bacterium]|jgi:hypothetical protein